MRNAGSLGKWQAILCSMLLSLFLVQSVDAKPYRIDNSAIGKKLSLPVYQWRDPSKPTRGAIFAVHGLTFYAKSFDNFAKYLASQGYVVYAQDLRGFGRWKRESAKFNGDSDIHWDLNESDLARVLDSVRKAHPGVPVIGLGESLGANYMLKMLSDGQPLDGAILAGPSIDTKANPRLRWIVDGIKGVLQPTKPLDVKPYMSDTVSNDAEIVKGIMKDKNMNQELSPVDLIKAQTLNIRTRATTEEVPPNIPILILAGELDKMFNHKATKKFAQKLTRQYVTYHTIPGEGHLLIEHRPVSAKAAASAWHHRAEQTHDAAIHVRR
jgi:alpha-beta hydrolase superfamily lysophospholipase